MASRAKRVACITVLALVASGAALLVACAESATAGAAEDDGGSSAPPVMDSGTAEDGAIAADADADASTPVSKGCSRDGFCLDELPSTQIPIGIWGSKDDDVWAVTERSIYHFDGTSWTTSLVLPTDGSRIRAIYGVAADDVWVVGEGASQVGVDAGLDGGAREALVLHYASRDGAAPAWRSLPGFTGAPSLVDAWRTADGSVWFLADELVFRTRGEEAGTVADVTLVPFQLGTVPCGPTTTCRINRVAWLSIAAFGDEIWVGGYNRNSLGVRDLHYPIVARYAGAQWSVISLLPGGENGLPIRRLPTVPVGEARFRVPRDGTRRAWIHIAASGLSPEDAFVVDVGEDGRFTAVAGHTRASWLSCRPLAVFAPKADAAWLTDGYGVCRWDGTGTTLSSITIDAPLLRARAVWSGASTTWVVGERQLVMGAAPNEGIGFILRRPGGLP